MSSPPPGARSAALTVRWLLAIGLIVVSGAMPSTAWAYWNSGGTGTGTATVATLPSMAVTATSPLYSDEVAVSWEEPAVPAGMAIAGYRVVRVAGGTPSPACETTSSVVLPPTTLSCVDSGLADGAADYVVTAVVGTWTTAGTTDDPVTVAADRTAPSIRLSGAERSNALIDRRDGEALLFFRPGAGGSIRIDAELTDEETGPASATFAAVSAAGWSHAAETVGTGTGSAPTVTYRSGALDFAPGASTPSPIEITGVDERGNARTRALTFVADADPPTGGALTVNDVEADASGTQSWDTDGTFTVSGVALFVEAESASASGLADVVLTRESASLSAGACSAFGGASTLDLTAPVQEAGLPDGCYRYSLTGTDRVGNAATIATTVRVDTTAPTGGALRANSVDALPAGSVSVTSSGSWSVTRTDFVDSGSGLASSTLTRAQGTLADGSCQSFVTPTPLMGSPGEASAATGCYRYVLTGLNAAGLSTELSTTVWVDRVAPAGGAVVVNGQPASAGGTTSTRPASDIDVSSLVGYSDAESGIASSTLVRTFAPMTAGVCGTFDPESAVTVSGTGVISGLPDGCHRFTLTGTDLAGNTSSILTTVRLDASPPTSGVLTVAGVPGTASGAMAYTRVSTASIAWTKFADPESGMTIARVDRTTSASLTNGVCVTPYGSPLNLTATLTPVAGTVNQTLPTSLRCYEYLLTGTNGLGVSSTLKVTLMFDTTSPTSSGSLRVNNSTTTNPSAPSTNTSGTYTVSAVRTFTDGESGMASNVLTRTYAPVTANVCGTYVPATTVTLASPPVVPPAITESGMAPGCYRYTQTGTNAVGGATSVSTYVRVDTTAPVGGSLTANAVEATTGTASQSWSTTGAWTVERTDYTDPETTLTSTLSRATASVANGICSSFTGTATILGAPAESGVTAGCVRYILTGRNSLGLTAPVITTIVRIDTTPPTGGTFTVNGSAATAAGSSSSSTSGTFTVVTGTAFADTQSGVTSSTFTRTYGPTCATLDDTTTVPVTGASPVTETGLAAGCYRYVRTGVNSAGLSTTLSTTVTVGP